MVLAASTSSLWGAGDKGPEKAGRPFDPVRQFDHLGVFTIEKKPNERLVEASKV